MSAVSEALAALIAEREKMDRAIAGLRELLGSESTECVVGRPYRKGLTAAIIATVNAHPDGIRGCDVARAVGRKQEVITSRLSALAGDNRIAKLGVGLWGPAPSQHSGSDET